MNVADGRAPWSAGMAAASVAAVAIFIMPGSVGEYRLSKWALAGVLVAALAVFVFGAVRRSQIGFRSLDLRLCALAAVTTAAAVIAPLESTEYAIAHVGAAMRWGLGLAFAYLTALSLAAGGRSAHRQSAMILIGAAGICALVVALQAATIYPFTHLIREDPEFRTLGTFGNPNWAAAFLLTIVPICLALRRDSASPRGSSWLLALAVLIGLAVIGTRSKGGILALTAGIAIFKILEPGIHSRVRWMTVSAVAIAAGGVLAIAAAGQLSAVSWIRGRVFLWKAALPMLAERPWTGVGLGGFPAEYPTGAARVIAGNPTAFMPLNSIEFLYNEPLQLAVEGGVPAAVLFMALVGLSIHAAFRHGDSLSRGVGSGLAALSVYSLVDAPFQIPATGMLLWFMLGWTMARFGRDSRARASVESVPPATVVFAAAAMLGIVVFGMLQGARFVAGNALWTAGTRAMSVGDHTTAVSRLTAAVRYLPENGRLRVLLGRALAAHGQTEAALSEFDAALRVQFDFDTAFFRLEMLEQLRGPSAVLREWEVLARMFPLLVSPNYHIGRIRWQDGDLDGAATAFGQILATRQDTTLAAMYQHEARAMLHRIEEARQTR
jgi:O-antigen ligase